MVKNPLITTVIPVYNVEAYLRATLDSVIAQDIGFADNIEIILVDDGSPDHSGVICQEYRDKYPDNVRYIRQQNAGVSVARNKGLAAARGKYVQFLDSDDLLSRNAYRKLIELLESEKTQIDFAALKIEFFDDRVGGHPLNFKFSGNRVIDVSTEPAASMMHMATCLIRRGAIKQRFRDDIKISEDVRFLSDLLLPKKKYGVVSDAYYFYRKRSGGGSAIDTAHHDESFYTVTPREVYQHILETWRIADNAILPYAQHLVMYDLQWRLDQEEVEGLSDNAVEKYKSVLAEIIKSIDDSIIIAKHDIKANRILYALKLKYGNRKIPDRVLQDFKRFHIAGTEPQVVLQFVTVEANCIKLEGYLYDNPLHEAIGIVVGDEHFTLDRSENIYAANRFLGEIIDTRDPFTVTIPLADNNRIDLKFVTGDGLALRLIPKRFTGLSVARGSYVTRGGRTVINFGDHLRIRSANWPQGFRSEMVWLMRVIFALRVMWALGQIRAVVRSPMHDAINRRKLVKAVLLPFVMLLRNIGTDFYRLAYLVMRPFYHGRDVWIVSDRTQSAGDNGEAFFRYVMSNTDHRAGTLFVLSRQSDDYQRLRAEFGGNIVAYESLRYRLLYLQASKIISSQAEDYVINPFEYRLHQVNNLYKYDFVFLQHGIIKDDISDWLNRFNKNIRLFITSTQDEYNSVLQCPYYYGPDEVLLSGLPRFDQLVNQPTNKIILAPTWRHELVRDIPLIDGRRGYSAKFKKSDYFQFFNGLINDARLQKVMKKQHLKGDFLLHPSLEAQVADFEQTETFSIGAFPHDYQKAFREGKLLITDYSSVVFDFAYLDKPVLYVQRDRDGFFSQHTYKRGYFDYDRDGFGPVARNREQAVDYIIEAIEHNFVIDKKYQKRIQKFYKFHDKNNSKRIYDAICALGGDQNA